jgi:type IV pilus assembly protein PilC
MATRTFDYAVRDQAGAPVRGRLVAPDEQSLVRQLRSMGYVPTEVKEVGKGFNRDIQIAGLGEKVTLKDLAVMCRQLATMVSAGLPLLKALSTLVDQTEKRPMKEALTKVAREIQSGASLSGAMAKQPKIFPALLVNLTKAGETSGFLDRALLRVASTYENEVALRSKIKAAMMYPIVVLILCVVSAAAMLIFIVPVFEKMCTSLGGKLPLPTHILVVLSDQMKWLAPLGIAAGIGGRIVWKRIKDKPPVRLVADRWKLKIPVFGKLFSKVAISRFTRNFGTMLGAGVPALGALDVVADVTGNAVLTNAIRDVQAGVRQGHSIGERMSQHDIFPAMVVNMVQVGEDSGQMETMLDKVADFYDDEVENMTEGLTAMLEPLLIVVLASVVGSMIIALYMPMFSIFNNIK